MRLLQEKGESLKLGVRLYKDKSFEESHSLFPSHQKKCHLRSRIVYSYLAMVPEAQKAVSGVTVFQV